MKKPIKTILTAAITLSVLISGTAYAEGDTAAETIPNTTTVETTEAETPDPQPAHVHEWSDWEIIDDPECEVEGEQSRKCMLCGRIETEAVPARGHVWGEWETIEEPTHFKTGSAVRSCDYCEAEETKELEKRAFTSEEKKANNIVEKYLSAAKAYDIKKMNSCFKNQKPKLVYPSKRVVSTLKKGATRIRYEVKDITFSGNKCTVTAEVTHPDYYNDAKNAMKTAIKYYSSYKPDATSDEVAKYFIKLFKKRVKYETTTRTIKFSLVKTDGKWKIKTKTQDLMDIAVGYFTQGAEAAI